MVAIVGGNGLGLETSSLALAGTSPKNASAGALGKASTGQAGESIYVNAATGNLVVQREDEVLTATGLDTHLLRTYNSLGKRTDDNRDNWQMSVVKTLGALTGNVNTAGSTIACTSGDGSTRVFSFDAQRNCYVNHDGQDAFDMLAFAGNTWTLTDGATQARESYDWNAGTGRITATTDADGNRTAYAYTGNLLTEITDASGETLRLKYNGTQLMETALVRADRSTLTRTRYAYDSANRLSSVTVDLTPDDGSVTDGKTYVTAYTYVGATTQLAGVTQSDGTSISFNDYDARGRLTRFTQVVDGINRVTTLAYDNGQTRITDALGAVTTVSYDGEGRLKTVATPAQTLSYEYDANGHLQAQTDGRNKRITYRYDANGNQVEQRDGAGNVVSRRFGDRNQLLAETVTGADGKPQTTRYLYDAANRLRFTVTPEGRVTENRYNARGLRSSSIAYAANRLPADNSELTESGMAAWAATADNTRISRTDFTYDARGNLGSATSFASTDKAGNGIADGSQSVLSYVYDQSGLLLSTVTANGNATVADGNDGITRYAHDGLGRLASSTDALGRSVIYRHDASGNVLTVIAPNGLSTMSVRNAAGELVSVVSIDAMVAGGPLGATQYKYDADGRLRFQMDGSGVKQYWLYDQAGRQVAAVDGNGDLTEWQYDGNDQVTRTIRYATALSAAKLASLVDAKGNPANVDLSAIRPVATAGDQVTWKLYDDAGRLAVTVDELGFVTRNTYDGASRLVSTVRYANPVKTAAISAATLASDAAVTPVPDAANDRRTSTIYDNDGRQVGVVDGNGFLQCTDVDGAGRAVHTIAYAKADMSLHGMSAAALQAWRGNAANCNDKDSHAWTFYDGQGRETVSVNAEGYVTKTSYDLKNNRRTQTIVMDAQGGVVAALLAQSSPDAMAIPAYSIGRANIKLWDYDQLGQLASLTDSDGTITHYQYNAIGKLVRTDRAWNTSDLRTTTIRYDKLGRVTGEMNGEGSAWLSSLPSNATAAQIDEAWAKYGTRTVYDAGGRKTCAIDAAGNRTLFYYDAAGNVAHVIDALGQVTSYTTNALGQVTQTVHVATPLGKDTLASLSGGLADAKLSAAISGLASASDGKVSTSFTLRGEVEDLTDEEGFLTHSAYDAFGERTSSKRVLDATRTTETTYLYDRRGLLKDVTEDAGGLKRVTHAEYDAFGRMISQSSPDKGLRQWEYDRLGRLVQTTDRYNASERWTWDAFGRELKHTDALGKVTSTSYDDFGRRVTVTTPEGVTMVTTRNAVGDVVKILDSQNRTTSYEYNRDGALRKTRDDALATVEENRYDNAGRLLESIDRNGVNVSFTYDALNRILTRTVDPDGEKLSTSYAYDGKSRTMRITDPNGVVKQTTYDRRGKVVAVTMDPDGLNLKTEYALDADGNTMRVTEAAGTAVERVTTYSYDKLGRRRSQTDATGNSTSYEYDLADRLVSRTDAAGNVTRIFHDAGKNVSIEIDAEGNATRSMRDAAGNLIETRRYATKVAKTAAPDFSLATPLPESADDAVVTNLYDGDGRLAFTVDSLRGVTEQRYDGNGNVTATISYSKALPAATLPATKDVRAVVRQAGFYDPAHDQVSHQVFDSANRMVMQVDGTGAMTEFKYDNNGNLVERRAYATPVTLDPARLGEPGYQLAKPAADDNRDQHAVMAYDKANRLIATATAQRASGGTIDWAVALQAYKPGKLTRTVLAATLRTVAASSQPLPTITAMQAVARTADGDAITEELRDAAGRLTKVTDPLGTVTSYAYDRVGNRVSSRVTAPQASDGFASAERLTRTVADAAGRPRFVVAADGAVTETRYDALGNPGTTVRYARRLDVAALNDTARPADVEKLLQPLAGQDRVERRLFDSEGHVIYAIDANGYVTRTDYDALGRIAATTEFVSPLALAPTATLSEVAIALKPQLDAGGDGKRVNTFIHDAAGRLKKSTDPLGNTESFTYDAAGSKTSFTNKNGDTWTYDHDAGGRVTVETSPQLAITRVQTDAAGNLLRDAAGKPVVAVDGVTQAVRTVTAYDNFGNVVSRTEAAGTPEERVTQWSYSPDNRQIATFVPNARVYASEGGNVATNGANGDASRSETTFTLVSTVTYDALGNAVVARDASGKYRYRVVDALGRLRFEIDALGYVTKYDYDGFGDVTALTRFDKGVDTSARNGRAYTVKEVSDLLNGKDHQADRIIRTQYDRLGRAVRVIEPTADAYDATGALGNASFTAARTTDKTYNAFGELIRQSVYGANAGGAALTVSADTAYSYDKLGQRIAEISMVDRKPGEAAARGYLTTLAYDSRGNLKERIEYASAISFADRDFNGVSGYAFAALVAGGDDRITRYGYDALNRKTSEAQVNANAVTTYGFDAAGNVTSVTDAAGNVTYSYYDALGRLTATAMPPLQRQRAQAAQLYIAILGRAPDKAGLDAQVGALQSGVSLEEIAQRVWNSPEAVAARAGLPGFQNNPQDTLIYWVYNRLLGRDPDLNGLAAWRIWLAQGKTAGQFVVAVAGTASDAMNTDAVVLNDKTALALDQASQGVTNAGALATAMTLETAASIRRIDIAKMYLAVLGRAPTADELQTQFKADRSGKVLADFLFQSDEGKTLYPAGIDAKTALMRLMRNVNSPAAEIGAQDISRYVDQDGHVVTSLTAAVTGMLDALYAASVTDAATLAARGRLDAKVCAGLPGAINLLSAATPMTEYQRDALGNLVRRIDYAGGADIATANLRRAVSPSGDDRVTYASYDKQGNARQRIDAEGNAVNFSYDAAGRLAKQWQTVRDADGLNPATVYTVNRYDADGQLVETITPAASDHDAVRANGTVSSQTGYNAFGEVTERRVDGQLTEFTNYDNAGHAWRTNAGDGVVKIAQFDVQGHQTVELRSIDTDLGSSVSSAKQAAAMAGLVRNDTRYDLLGHVTARIQPQQFAANLFNTPTQLSSGKLTLSAPPQQGNPQFVGRGTGAPSWQGSNEVMLGWNSLAGLGSGDVKIQLDYQSGTVTSPTGTVFAPVAGSVTQILPADDAQDGATLTWNCGTGTNNQVIPGYGQMTKVTVWKKDVSGQWVQLFSTGHVGNTGNTLRLNAPPDPAMQYQLSCQSGSGQSSVIAVANMGDMLLADMAGIPDGDYSYALQIRSGATDAFATIEEGRLSVSQPQQRDQLVSLYVALLNRAPDTAGLQSALRAIANGTSMAALAQNMFNSPEAQTAPSPWAGLNGNATEFVRRLYANALGLTLAAGDPIVTAAASRLGGPSSGWGAGIVAILAEIADSSDGQRASARALLANKLKVAEYFALGAGGYNAAEARDVLKAVTASDTAAGMVLASKPLYRRQVALLYTGLLNRAPDAVGLALWTDNLAKGIAARVQTGSDSAKALDDALGDVATSLLGSDEGKTLYPPSLGDADFLGRFSRQALGREPDAAILASTASIATRGRARVALDLLLQTSRSNDTDPVLLNAQRLVNNRTAVGLAYGYDLKASDAAATAINAAVTADADPSVAVAKMAAALQAGYVAAQANAAAIDNAVAGMKGERNLEMLAGMYAVLLNRAPDLSGLMAQVQAVQQGTSLDAVAQGFYLSGEAQAPSLYLNRNDADFVAQVYRLAFNRAPTVAESSRWIGALAGNASLRGKTALAIIGESLAYDGTDGTLTASRNLLNNKIDAGLVFAMNLGGQDITLARDMLARVTADGTTAATSFAADSLSAALAAKAGALYNATSAALIGISNAAVATDAQAKLLPVLSSAGEAAGAMPAETSYAQATALYAAILNRAPDHDGLLLQASYLRGGTSLAGIAANMLNSAEAQQQGWNGLANDAFVAKVYVNAFGSSASGVDQMTWAQQLASGTPRGQVLCNILGAVQSAGGSDAALLTNRIAAGMVYALDLGGNDPAVAVNLNRQVKDIGVQSALKSAADALVAGNKPTASPLGGDAVSAINGINAELGSADNLVSLSANVASAAATSNAAASQSEGNTAVQLTRLYRLILKRDPDVTGYPWWYQRVQNGQSIESVAEAFAGSAEAQGGSFPTGLSDADFITRVYQNLLGRGPDAATLSTWMSSLAADRANPATSATARGKAVIGMMKALLHNTDMPAADLAQRASFVDAVDAGMLAITGQLTSSPYVFTFLSARGLTYGEAAGARGLVNAMQAFVSGANAAAGISTLVGNGNVVRLAQVTNLYLTILNRTPDLAGLQWQLQSGQDVTQLATNMLASAEAQARFPAGQSNAAFIASIYQQVLGRTADAATTSRWTSAIEQQGRSRGAVYCDIVGGLMTNPDTATFGLPSTADMSSRAALLRKLSGALGQLRDAAAPTFDPAAILAGLLNASSAATNGQVASVNGAVFLSPSASQQLLIVQVYSLLLARAPSLAELTDAVLKLQSGQYYSVASLAGTLIDSPAGQQRFAGAYSTSAFLGQLNAASLNNAGDADTISRWSNQYAWQQPAQVAMQLASVLAGYRGAEMPTLTAQALQNARVTQGLTALAQAATAPGAFNDLASQLSLNAAGTGGAQPTPASQQAASLTLAYLGALNRASDTVGLMTQLARVSASASPELETQRIAQELLDSPEGQGVYPAWLSDSDFISRLYGQVIGRTIDGAALSTWSATLAGYRASADAPVARGKLLLNLLNQFTSGPGLAPADLPLRASLLRRQADGLRSVMINAVSMNTPAGALSTLLSSYTNGSAAIRAGMDAPTTPAAQLRQQIIRLYVLVTNRGPDIDGLSNWSSAIASGTQTLADLAKALLDTPLGQSQYPATQTDADFVRRLFQVSLGRTLDTTPLAQRLGEVMQRGRAGFLVDLAAQLAQPGTATLDNVASATLLSEKVANSLAALQQQEQADLAQKQLQASTAAKVATQPMSVAPVALPASVTSTSGTSVITTKPQASADGLRPLVNITTDRWGNVQTMSDARNGALVTRYRYNASNEVTQVT
ncbi:DUF4214 domain-containing protein [Noviherbaspirillum galbum]|uniref:DUF4214 domain-containing protein n=1 Tax=Noviherbaspirillum galbum TaxID=2709383 RepID=A0A6B3SUS3_9BURK|nr:DUF4214 domain-containing protein [Noviherbaspirillum galbum]NEX63125.1 DUF4214 domain-containing protein [Noviherbaspirillum galbum]